MTDSSIGDAKTSAGSAAPAPDTLAPGTLFGQYRILRLLGRGGMGEVYEVEHKVLRRKYALKLLPPTLEWRGVALERFEREAQVMANLEHPNIIRVDEFGETEGRYWLRMELAGGVECSVTGDQCSGKRVVSLQDLADARGGKIPQEELLAILKQVLAGLDYAHQRGAIHRDLKPSNILLFPSPQSSQSPNTPIIKITDFGLVRLVGEDWVRSQAQLSVQRSMSLGDQPTMGKAEPEGTSTRSLLGTYEYMSPEQKRGEEADQRSDLYAVGLMTFKLLTGRNPGTKPPSRIDRELSPKWDEVVEKALEEEAGERLANATGFLDLLEAMTPVPAPSLQEPPKRKTELVKAEATIPLPVSAPAIQKPLIQKPTPGEGGKVPSRLSSTQKAGDLRKLDLGGGVTMGVVWIPPGEFLMGSPESEDGRFEDEGPQHKVTISKGFWMGKYPVDQEQWNQVMGSNPSKFKGLKNPVEQVSWIKAKEFCKKMGGRLPMDAEWEYACRAGTTGPYAGELCQSGWYDDNAEGTTHPVGQKQSNAWGLYDMHGNIWEWCEDGKRNYTGEAKTDPEGPTGSSRVLRGGSWYDYARDCRSAVRYDDDPGSRDGNLGFRLVVN